MSFTNAQLATKIADLITYWSTFNAEYSDWIGGEVGGGPNTDGDYPLTNWAGEETLLACPAQLADNVTGYVAIVDASAVDAAASAAAAATSESNAATSETVATAQAVLADADRISAEAAESGAVDAKVVAIAQAAAAVISAAAALASEVEAAAQAVLADASADAAAVSAAEAAASAIEAATFDPDLFAELSTANVFAGILYLTASPNAARLSNNVKLLGLNNASTANVDLLRVATDDTIQVGQSSFEMNIASTVLTAAGSIAAVGAVTGSNLNVSNWDTAYGWGDHSGNYLPDDGILTISGNQIKIDSPAPFLILTETGVTGTPAWWWGGDGGSFNLRLNNAAPYGIIFNTNAGNDTITSVGIPTQLAVTGTVTGSNLNVSNWDTAYGWGDHASGGYSDSGHNHSGVYLPIAGTADDSDLLEGLDVDDLFNNMSLANAGHTSFDAQGAIDTFGFGHHFVQGSTNGPAGGTQFYVWQQGLGSQYTSAQYNAQFAIARTLSSGERYLHVRFQEAGVYSAWEQVAATSDLQAPITDPNFIGSVTIGDGSSPGDQAVLLDFDTDRGWQFINTGTGSSAKLELRSNNDKHFNIASAAGVVQHNFTAVGAYTALGIITGADFRGVGYATQSTPTYSSSSDTDSGFYNEASNVVAISTAGVRRMQLYASLALFAPIVATTGADVAGSAGRSHLSANMLNIDGKEAIDGNDTWLRLNQNNDFTAGVYTPYGIRLDGNLTANGNIVGDGGTNISGILALSFAATGSIAMPGTGTGSLVATSTAGSLRISNGTQWADIGCRNSSYCHIDTSASAGFYSYDNITVVGTANLMKASHGNFLYHQSTAYDNNQNGGITFSTSAPSGGTTGDIWFEYT